MADSPRRRASARADLVADALEIDAECVIMTAQYHRGDLALDELQDALVANARQWTRIANRIADLEAHSA